MKNLLVKFIGDECEIETAMAEYEKWLNELEEKPIECEPGYDEWCEEQIRQSELKRHLIKIELLPERAN